MKISAPQRTKCPACFVREKMDISMNLEHWVQMRLGDIRMTTELQETELIARMEGGDW